MSGGRKTNTHRTVLRRARAVLDSFSPDSPTLNRIGPRLGVLAAVRDLSVEPRTGDLGTRRGLSSSALIPNVRHVEMTG
jgi:hypothetical protein